MIIYLILIPYQLTQATWNIPIQYSTLCSCNQIIDPTLCSSCQFCQLDMDFECTEVLNYNCSYFNEQTVLYLCSQLDRCYQQSQKCVDLINCTELTGSTDQECQQQSNRCGTSQNNICQLTQCQSYLNEQDCNNSIFNIRFDNIGYGNVCYWNNQNQSCGNLVCENVLPNQICTIEKQQYEISSFKYFQTNIILALIIYNLILKFYMFYLQIIRVKVKYLDFNNKWKILEENLELVTKLKRASMKYILLRFIRLKLILQDQLFEILFSTINFQKCEYVRMKKASNNICRIMFIIYEFMSTCKQSMYMGNLQKFTI